MAAAGRRQPEWRSRQLLQKLQCSSQRFSGVMRTLLAKYDRPFEGDSLVHITTLTYQSPEGLRVWGGRRVTRDIFQNVKTSLEKEDYHIGNIMRSPFTDVRSNGFDESLVQKNGDISLKMYSFGNREVPKFPKILSTKDSPKALLGCSCNGPGKNSGIPVKSTSSCRGPHDTRVVAMPPNRSLLAWRARMSSPLGDTALQNEECAQDLTLSDIYAEMLCSLYKCLPSQKMVLISTKKYISKAWFPKKRKLNVTLTMKRSFLKNSQKFRVIPGEQSGLICRKDPKQICLPCSEADPIVQDRELLSTKSSPLALKGSLPRHSTQESPSRTKDVRQATPSPSRSHVGSQSPATPSLCLPPAKERLHPVQQGTPGRDVLGQERHLSRPLVMPRMLQTPKNAPLSQERLYRKRSASDASETCPKTGFPRDKFTKARKFLPSCMEKTPCKGRGVIDSMFDKYFQETTQWAQELLFLKKSGPKSNVLTQSKFRHSLKGLGPCDDPQETQKAASPHRITRNSLYETVTALPCAVSPRATSKGDFSSLTKRQKVSSSQTWDHSSPSKIRHKAQVFLK
ncbi:Holliday junction recognition protein-like isoform X2 [Petaurus breviceps papuanus]|uniref:Holliday junction recognition protein-like isoform X2 n=1 Tax=Petaurus breviceps papuanus TaxID=3040969 RepID=UPI0036D76E44